MATVADVSSEACGLNGVSSDHPYTVQLCGLGLLTSILWFWHKVQNKTATNDIKSLSIRLGQRSLQEILC